MANVRRLSPHTHLPRLARPELGLLRDHRISVRNIHVPRSKLPPKRPPQLRLELFDRDFGDVNHWVAADRAVFGDDGQDAFIDAKF